MRELRAQKVWHVSEWLWLRFWLRSWLWMLYVLVEEGAIVVAVDRRGASTPLGPTPEVFAHARTLCAALVRAKRGPTDLAAVLARPATKCRGQCVGKSEQSLVGCTALGARYDGTSQLGA